jgi:WD40 repeat protein
MLGSESLEGEAIQVPNGIPGESVDIAVSDSFGEGTLASAASFYASPAILPEPGILQLTFDSHRNRLYVLKATEVDVLDAGTLGWRSPMVFPASAANGSYKSMALTPDGTKLVVVGSIGPLGATPQLIVLDPDNGLPPSVITYSGSFGGPISGAVAVTNSNKVVLLTLASVEALVFDLSTSTFSLIPFPNAQVVKTSADGSHLYGALLNVSSGSVYSIDPSTFVYGSVGFGYLFWTDLAVSQDGSHLAAVLAPPYGAGDNIGFFSSSLQYVNSNAYPDFSPPDDSGVLGVTFSPEGNVLVVPLGDSIEFWDAAQGTLRARLMTPEELQRLVYPEGAVAPMIALDATGQTIYAASVSGVTVLTLPKPLDQITPMQWPLVRVGAQQFELRGPIAARMAAMQSQSRTEHAAQTSH